MARKNTSVVTGRQDTVIRSGLPAIQTCYTLFSEWQVTGGSDFDFVWEERVNVSLALLREAADAIAARGSSALQPVLVVESLLAVLFNPLPANSIWGRPQWPVRFFDDKSQPPRSASESLDHWKRPGRGRTPMK